MSRAPGEACTYTFSLSCHGDCLLLCNMAPLCVTLSGRPCPANHTVNPAGRLSEPAGTLALPGSLLAWAQASFGMWGSYRPRRAIPSRIPKGAREQRQSTLRSRFPKAEKRVRGAHIGLDIVLRMRDGPTSISVQADPVGSASVVKGASPHKAHLPSFLRRPSHLKRGRGGDCPSGVPSGFPTDLQELVRDNRQPQHHLQGQALPL